MIEGSPGSFPGGYPPTRKAHRRIRCIPSRDRIVDRETAQAGFTAPVTGEDRNEQVELSHKSILVMVRAGRWRDGAARTLRPCEGRRRKIRRRQRRQDRRSDRFLRQAQRCQVGIGQGAFTGKKKRRTKETEAGFGALARLFGHSNLQYYRMREGTGGTGS